MLFTKQMIDWKAVNYLIDRLTVYEDDGCEIDIMICLKSNIDDKTFNTIYIINDDFYEFEFSSNQEKSYFKNGLYYGISIDIDKEDYVFGANKLIDFYDRVMHKFIVQPYKDKYKDKYTLYLKQRT